MCNKGTGVFKKGFGWCLISEEAAININGLFNMSIKENSKRNPNNIFYDDRFKLFISIYFLPHSSSSFLVKSEFSNLTVLQPRYLKCLLLHRLSYRHLLYTKNIKCNYLRQRAQNLFI